MLQFIRVNFFGYLGLGLNFDPKKRGDLRENFRVKSQAFTRDISFLGSQLEIKEEL